MGLRPIQPPTGSDVYTIASGLPTQHTPTIPAPVCSCQQHAPATPVYYTPAPVAQRSSIAPYVAGGIAAVGGVAVIGLIAIGLLLAFAVSALSIAVVAVVLRTLLNPPQNKGR